MFRKRPVVIEAFQVPDNGEVSGHGAIRDFFERHGFKAFRLSETKGYDIGTLEGTMHASPGDWIIRGVAGEFYPCKPDIFAVTYEQIDEVPR
jgi:hypothetical protein